MAATGQEHHGAARRIRQVRVTCRTCGDQRLSADAVSARVCSEDGSASYHFRCPSCGLLEVRPMASSLVGSLQTAGVALTRWSAPAELREAHVGAPLTTNDLIDFHFALESDSWFEELTRGS
jgi:hypothetical protein